MINPRNKARLETLRRIITYYKDLAVDYVVPDPIVIDRLNEQGTIVHYIIFKEYERDGKLKHDSFAVVHGHTGETVFYRRVEGNSERIYSSDEFENKTMPAQFLMEIDYYIEAVWRMIGSPR